MQRSDFPRFKATLAGCAELWDRDMSDEAVMLWWRLLERFDIEQVVRGFAAAVSDPDRGDFMPRPAAVIRAIEGTRTDRALIAWGKVMEGIARVGWMQDVVFDDPIIHVVVLDMGGWTKLCQTDPKDMSYAEHRFCTAYRAYAPRESELTHPPLLRGARDSDDEYERKGLPAPRPKVIGNRELAKQVYLTGSTDGSRGLIGIAHAAHKLVGRASSAALPALEVQRA